MDNKLLNEYLNNGKRFNIKNIITKLLLSVMLVLIALIYAKSDDNHVNLLKKYVFEDTFNFSSFNSLYKSLKKEKDTDMVISNNKYNNKVKYLDGYSYNVNDNLIETFKSGIIVYVGNKDGYNNTVIIQGSDGYDIWYGNLQDINVSIYDYIKSDTIIGESNKLYLKVLKDGKNVNIDEYLGI